MYLAVCAVWLALLQSPIAPVQRVSSGLSGLPTGYLWVFELFSFSPSKHPTLSGQNGKNMTSETSPLLLGLPHPPGLWIYTHKLIDQADVSALSEITPSVSR